MVARHHPPPPATQDAPTRAMPPPRRTAPPAADPLDLAEILPSEQPQPASQPPRKSSRQVTSAAATPQDAERSARHSRSCSSSGGERVESDGPNATLGQPVRDAISPALLAVVAVATDPALAELSPAAKARKAGVSIEAYRRALRDPLVSGALAEALGAVLAEHAGRVLGALVASAQLPGRDGSQDRRIYLQALGALGPRADQRAAPGGVTVHLHGTISALQRGLARARGRVVDVDPEQVEAGED